MPGFYQCIFAQPFASDRSPIASEFGVRPIVGGSHMSMTMPFPAEDLFELRLFLEELVCNVCRFSHVAEQKIAPQEIRIRQEVNLGIPNAFADILIRVPHHSNYFVEVKYGYPTERIIESFQRKYGKPLPLFEEISKLILMVDRHNHPDWDKCAKQVKEILPSSWELEVWDEPYLLSLIRKYFDVEIESLSPDKILELRLIIDRAKGTYAFGAAYNNDPLDSQLLWQFGYWRLHDLFEASNRTKRLILPPASYPAVIVLFADLSGFSGYVRETPRAENNSGLPRCILCKSSISNHQRWGHALPVPRRWGHRTLWYSDSLHRLHRTEFRLCTITIDPRGCDFERVAAPT